MQVPVYTSESLDELGSADFGATPALPGGGISINMDDIPEEFRSRVVTATGDVPQYIDFFDVLEQFTFEFPDGVQYVILKAMTEGDRKRYLNKTNREVRMNTGTKELKMQAAAGDDKHALLELCITGWNVLRQGRSVPFSNQNLKAFLDGAPPSLIDRIEKRIREINPWLLGDEDSLETLYEERDELENRIKVLEDRKAKN